VHSEFAKASSGVLVLITLLIGKQTVIFPFRSVRAFNNKVLALAEGGPPVEINPETLDTLNDVKYTSSFFSAHPKIDPDTKSK
jgi:hypothetical protein